MRCQELFAFLIWSCGGGLALSLLYRWEEIVNDVVLPVADLSFTFDFRLCVLDVVDVQSRIVLKVSESHLVEFLCE